MPRILLFVLALWAACSGLARADEAALTRRATELRDSPGGAGRSIASLPVQAAVIRGDVRSGPWVQVRTAAGASGWLHMFDLGSAATPAVDGVAAFGSALRGVSNLLGVARPAQTTGTTAGIRGLGAEDLARAWPNPAAVRRMDSLRQSESDARAYAQTAGWRPVSVPPLPAPEPPAPASVAGPGQPEMP